MKKALLLCAASVCAFPATAMAQSTGTTDFEGGPAIVVTGTRQRDVAGVQVPDTSRARAALGSEFIQRQTPGQSINDVINQLPGVSFQNNDPYGSAGGTLTIRGFDSTRISQTFDGVPLNDSGNYALYSNQQLDPELIEQVNISLGSTDVDSPTAAASGSTVNYRTRLPTEDFHVRLQASVGEYNFFRVFGVIDTGEFTNFGTRAFFAASTATNDNVFNNRGVVYKQQYNARIYQPLGDNGDFISVAGHYNQNRNNFFGSVPLRTDLTQTPTNTAARNVPERFPLTDDERFYTIARCQINTVNRAGTADLANTCGSTFDERYNPSDTGNIRIGSRFTLGEGLILSVDPSIQFVSANGGGTVVGQEGLRDVNPAGTPGTVTPNACVANPTAVNTSCQTGYIGGTPYFGRDLNGDGDRLDTVRLSAPSQTRTRRLGLIASLRYEINDDHNIRIAYSYDRARHRQTGEVGLLQINGEPFNFFPINDPLADASGNILQKRDRLSYAILHQIGGEYRGEFMDDRLTITAGLRAPFFTRDLNNYCATSSATGFVECFGTNTTGAAAYAQFNGTVTVSPGPPAVTGPLQGPQQRVLKYNEILPSLGFVFDVTNELSVFANGSRGLQVPGTDNLYNSFFFAPDTEQAQPRPEKTDNFDVGLRYRGRGLLAQASAWYTRFEDRLASSYDPELERTVYRNLGTVIKYGIDASVAYQVIPEVQLYAYGSYLWSEIQDNIQIGGNESVNCDTATTTNGTCAVTAGRREAGAPVYTFGGRIQGQLGPVEIGIQAKRTGPRYVNDVNLPITLCNGALVGGACPAALSYQVYGAKAPAYTLVDADIRIPLEMIGANDRTWLQLNVTNLFDVTYVGGFGGNLLNNTAPFVQIGSPRAFSATLVVGF